MQALVGAPLADAGDLMVSRSVACMLGRCGEAL